MQEASGRARLQPRIHSVVVVAHSARIRTAEVRERSEMRDCLTLAKITFRALLPALQLPLLLYPHASQLDIKSATMSWDAKERVQFAHPIDDRNSLQNNTDKLTCKSSGFGPTNNTTSLFGAKPATGGFGSSTTTGGGIFGSNSNNTTASGGFGSGGFGSSSTNTNNAFGSNNNSSGSFSFGGAPKPATFGSSTSNSTPLFGQGGAGTTGGFGSSSSPFGASGSGTALGAQPVPPSTGTMTTAYAPTLENDGGNKSNYQSINFMQPYSKYSFEELRLADYEQGRRFGNASGQAGAFGSSAFGSGFGNNTSSAFGNNSATNNNPFGTSTNTNSAFGNNSNTGGGLFGASKPATTGLFGGAASSSTSTGGLFGTANNNAASSPFGSNTSTGFGSSATGGGLFGNNQTNQTKSLFGNNTTTSNSGSGFSFGNNQNTSAANTTGGLFSTTTNNTASNPFGNNQSSGGGLFGNNNNNQQKPSLFTTPSTGFGASANQNQSSGGLFGGTSNNNTGGGLFGNSNTNTTQNSGGLFGNNISNTNSGGLFGNTNANQQKPGGLFGGSTFGNNTTNPGGGGLFGSTNNQSTGSGLFGATNNNNASGGFSFGNNKPASGSLFAPANSQQSTGFGNSLFGNSGNQGQQQNDFKVSSLNDPNPYGQTSIWTGLPAPTIDNSKPLFTPLAATQKLKESQSKPPPSLRLNQSRYMTPPRRSGFGFSYSTYGTPNSAASTPGGGSLSSSMYGSRNFNGGSFGRTFGKSASASNLRSHFNADGNGVLSPDAFSATSTRWSSGNMRRLTIDRSIRNDLFTRPSLPAQSSRPIDNGSEEPVRAITNGESSSSDPPNKLKKRVSFDKDITGGQNEVLNGYAAPSAANAEPSPVMGGFARDGSVSTYRNDSATPEVEGVRGNELAVVPEDRESDHVSPSKATGVQARQDPQPGDYWMKPGRTELGKTPRDKLTKFTGFEVGRRGCGKVRFDGAVDLTAINLDDVYEKLVEIRLRSVTVYPEASTKPPAGKGLNVPSTISIENSWPRARGQPSSATTGPVFDKHVNRLKKMAGTTFVDYDVKTGVWTFKVPHYTRYGLDYDDEDEEDFSQSQLSIPAESNQSGMDVDDDQEDFLSDEDDTFAFKQKTIPGGYGRRSAIDYDNEVASAEALDDNEADSHMEEDQEEIEEIEHDLETSMVGAYPPAATKPILTPTIGTPGKALINIEGDWAEQLQRTISPRKQNRDALREVQSRVLLDRTYEPMKPAAPSSTFVKKHHFRTSIDIMQSLFDRHEDKMAEMKGRKSKATPDFEV
jgi:nuclear pore complex protein Nup98-Nup96